MQEKGQMRRAKCIGVNKASPDTDSFPHLSLAAIEKAGAGEGEEGGHQHPRRWEEGEEGGDAEAG